MIRPATCVCFLLACGSGLYLYQAKHGAQMLDKQIERTIHASEALRDQTRLLHAEWTLLNDPSRLQTLADQFLKLKSVAPGQFTNLAELDNRLPAVPPPAPPPAPEPESIEPPAVPLAQAGPPAPAPSLATASTPAPAPLAQLVPRAQAAPAKTASEEPRHQPVPVPAKLALATPPVPAKPSEHRLIPPRPPSPLVAQASAPRLMQTESRPVAATPELRPVPVSLASAAPPRPAPRSAVQPAAALAPVPLAAPTPYGGSLLGMARSAAPPAPQPISVNQWIPTGNNH